MRPRKEDIQILASTAREMMNHARRLATEAEAEGVDEARRRDLRREADEWLDKAKEVANSAIRLAS